MIRRFFARASDDNGAVIVEFALILPIMLTMMFGTFEVSQLVRAQMKLSNAADTYAELIASTPASLSASAIADFCSGAQLVMAPFATSAFSASATSITNNLNTGPTIDWQNTACGSAATIANPTGLTTALASNPGDTVFLVQATYKYTSVLSYVLPANFTLSQVVFAHPRTDATIPLN